MGTTTFQTAEIIVLETGEYSDHSWHGPYRALKDFDIREAAEEFKASFKPEDEWDRPGPYEFVAWLAKAGFVEAIDCRTVHVGSYGTLEIAT